MTLHATKHRWDTLCARLNITPVASQYSTLIQAYTQPHRAYHDLQHLNECLALIDWSRENKLKECTDQLEYALWFHDAIYTPRKTDNEKKSADWACQSITQKTLQTKLRTLIMATCHNTQVKTAEEQLIVDIDLAILGRNKTRFTQYQKQIRQEYHWVPQFIYQKKRQAILNSFIDRPRIYHTKLFFHRFEAQARLNLNHT